jgi:hypothetical protein
MGIMTSILPLKRPTDN